MKAKESICMTFVPLPVGRGDVGMAASGLMKFTVFREAP